MDLEISPFALLLYDTWLNILCFQTPGFLKLFLWKSEFNVLFPFHSVHCTYYVTVTQRSLVYISLYQTCVHRVDILTLCPKNLGGYQS